MGDIPRENFAAAFSAAIPCLAVLPLMHILISAIYLCGFGLGFGASISLLYTPSDLLNLGAGWLPLLYIGLIIASPALVAAYRYEPRRPAARDARRSRHKRAALAAGVIILLASPGLAAWEIWRTINYPKPAITLLISQFPFLVMIVANGLYHIRRKSSRRLRELASLGMAIPAAFFMVSIEDGHQARYMDYQYAAAHFVSCKGRPVVRSFSAGKLAVNPDGTKAFLDEECAPLLSVPEPKWIVEGAKARAAAAKAQRQKLQLQKQVAGKVSPPIA